MKDNELNLSSEVAPIPGVPQVYNPEKVKDGVRKAVAFCSTAITFGVFIFLGVLVWFNSESAKTYATLVLGPWMPIYSSILTWYFAKPS